MEHLIIFDTTLRDGGHCRDAGLDVKDKLEIARRLALLQVDVIEAGYPESSSDEFQAVRQIAGEIRNVKIAALARATDRGIESAAKVLEKAESPRIHIYLSTSKAHKKGEADRARADVISQTREAVRLGKKFIDDIEFSPLDASRTDEEFLAEVLEAAIDAGATTVNISDTVGYAVPEPFGDLIHFLKTHVGNMDQAVLSVHCHDDLGLAVANSLAAVKSGARQVECTINGIGERAGNAALEEIVMALRARTNYFGVDTRIATEHLLDCSRLVGKSTGYVVPQNKAVVGENAFRKKILIPSNSFPKKSDAFQKMNPQSFGWEESDIDSDN